MPKANQTYALLMIIFSFAFAYRLLLLLWSGFPPGADIGLHNSVIYSITGGGNTDFLYNYYHIGGGLSLTFPGYHIFTASVMLFTGLPEYVAHTVVVSLFSALIVVCAFLITKRVFSVSAAYIVAFLAVISRFDIEMLTWAGYPNVITLMLIPLTYYLYLEKDRFSKLSFFVSTSIMAGSIFLTHSLSAAMFVAILAPVIAFVLLWPKTMETTRKSVLYWILPVVFGAILVSPFLIQVVPEYLTQYGSDANLSKLLPFWLVIPLFGVVAVLFGFSRKYYRKWLTIPTFLVAMWVFVPLVFTQGYLVGAAVDYNRFLYFLVLPVLVFVGLLIDWGSESLAFVIDKYRGSVNLAAYKIRVNGRFEGLQNKIESSSRRLAAAARRKRLYSLFVLVFLLVSFFAVPIFVGPSINVGQGLQNYYQAMDNQKWEAVQWLKENTTEGSVIVADAWYGWWLGGFAQRPTISAVEPAYLTVKREVDNATFASNLLDTDYVVDNGLIQVRDDGYLSRHNPEVIVKQNWTYAGYSFFTFNGSDFGILYNVNGVGDTRYVTLDELLTKETRVENYGDHVDIVVVQGNEFFNYTRTTTVYGGSQFVTISSKLQARVMGVTFASVNMKVQTTGLQVKAPYDNTETIGIVEMGTKDFGQLIFDSAPIRAKPVYASDTSEVVKGVDLLYTFNGTSEAQIDITAIAYSATNEQYRYDNEGARNEFFTHEMTKNLNADSAPKTASFTVFDYRQELKTRGISYIVLLPQKSDVPDKTENDVYAKFQLDPLFSLVFINEEVAIYKVN